MATNLAHSSLIATSSEQPGLADTPSRDSKPPDPPPQVDAGRLDSTIFHLEHDFDGLVRCTMSVYPLT